MSFQKVYFNGIQNAYFNIIHIFIYKRNSELNNSIKFKKAYSNGIRIALFHKILNYYFLISLKKQIFQ